MLGVIGAIAFVPLWYVSEPDQVAAARLPHLLSDPRLLQAGYAALALVPLLAGVAAVAALVALSHGIPERLERGLAYLGTLSLGIYITHFPFVEMWKGMPAWFLPINVAIATVIAVGATLALGKFRPTATLLLGERWASKARPLGDVKTETL